MSDLSISASNVVPPVTSTTTHLQPANTIAGEAISAGEVVCLVASDGKYYKADASVSTKRDVKGIAGNTASAAGQRIDIISASQNLVVGAHGGTIGAPYFSSSTAGKLCPLADLTTNDLATLVAYPVSTSGLEVLIAPALNALGA